MTSHTVTGSCLCGTVKYQVVNPAESVLHCHCWMCRKQHGAAFATWAFYPKERFHLLAGAEALQTYISSETVGRTFCRECGGSLFFASPEFPKRPAAVWITAGTLDGDPGRVSDGHIFVSSKADWYTITDGLPQFADE